MNIKIDLVISASPELLAALQTFTGVKPHAHTFPPDSVKQPENGEVKKARAKKIEYVPDGQAPEKIVLPSGEIISTPDIKSTDVKEETKTDLTHEMIIADAVPKSKAGHKDKIKAKVTELGYESITDLQPIHFDEFYAFLQTIPKPA